MVYLPGALSSSFNFKSDIGVLLSGWVLCTCRRRLVDGFPNTIPKYRLVVSRSYVIIMVAKIIEVCSYHMNMYLKIPIFFKGVDEI